MEKIRGLVPQLDALEKGPKGKRSEAFSTIDAIFNNHRNFDHLSDPGAWLALFQKLYAAVQQEKDDVLNPKSKGVAASAKRLEQALSVIRLLAENASLRLARRPVASLISHMTGQLVHRGRVFEPAAKIYPKALRKLLSYPPHLENLSPQDWRTLMGICWAALLGDRLRDSDDWDAEDGEELNGGDKEGEVEAVHPSIAKDLIGLIPVLLTSSNVPLVPPCPAEEGDRAGSAEPALGFSLLLKIHRYIKQQTPKGGSPSPDALPIDLARALNLILGELELNCRDNFTLAAEKLFPQLVSIWTSRSNDMNVNLREHVLISIRMMLPFIAPVRLKNSDSKEQITESIARILGALPKETGRVKAPILPLDIDYLRFQPMEPRSAESYHSPFQLAGLTAGFGFDASQAIRWAAIELYADCLFQMQDSVGTFAASGTTLATQTQPALTQTQRASTQPEHPPPTQTQHLRAAKRQRTQSSFDKCIAIISLGAPQARLLACQVIVFLLDKYWNKLHSDVQETIQQKLSDLLDDEDPALQSWGFTGLSCLAAAENSHSGPKTLPPPLPSTTLSVLASQKRQSQSIWERLWAHAIRKVSMESVSRAACHAADAILRTHKVDDVRCMRDIQVFLKNVDVQGPPTVSESSCSLLGSCLDAVRADVGLYATNLEDKVLEWFSKTFGVERTGRSRNQLDPATPANQLKLLGTICAFTDTGIVGPTVVELLPDCPVANRILVECRTERIRQLILHGTIPALPETSSAPIAALPAAEVTPSATSDVDSLSFLDGRPRRVSEALRRVLERALEEWAASVEIYKVTQPERIRVGVDLAVLVLAWQAAIQANRMRPDTTSSLRPAARLLESLILRFRKIDSIQAQLLVWRGFAPLFEDNVQRPNMWPILIKPDQASGIRRDILPPEQYAYAAPTGEFAHAGAISTKLLSVIWSSEELLETLHNVIKVGKAQLSVVVGTAGPATNVDADDEMGVITDADAANLPQSFEEHEAQRSTQLLIKTLVNLRLRGPLLGQPDGRPTKDVPLMNTLLSAEGPRFVQLGFAICDAIQDGSLRLTVDMVGAVLEDLQDRHRSYAARHDGEFARLILNFLARSIYLWLAPESGLCEDAILMAKRLVSNALNGKMSSWEARLQLLVFIDEYLDYDPTSDAWRQLSETVEADIAMGDSSNGIDNSPEPSSPLFYLLESICDTDARVRLRAASSAASIAYLPGVHVDHKANAYYGMVNRQAARSFTFDHFLTGLVWKLNNCVASARLRAATIFHLYEVAEFMPELISHLQPGLEAIAQRLGLDSLRKLFFTHANIVVIAQLGANQLPMSLPSSIYGCATRKEFATLCLEAAGAKILAGYNSPQNLNFFTALCDASGIAEAQARARHFPMAAAIAVTSIVSQSATKDLVQNASATLTALPGVTDGSSAMDLVKPNAELIVAGLLTLTDVTESNNEVAAIAAGISSKGGSPGEIFARLMAHDPGFEGAPEAIDPCFTALSVLQSLGYFRQHFKWSKRRMVFDALIRLFHVINESYLINEQRRFLRATALLVSIYSFEFGQPQMLQLFLRNLITLLPMDEIGGVALSMLEWGFEQIQSVQELPPDFVELLINLGLAYSKLHTNAHLKHTATRFDEWIASCASSWEQSEKLQDALGVAVVLWPSQMADHFPKTIEAHFFEIADIAKRPDIDALALSRQLAASGAIKATEAAGNTFLSSTFWHLKRRLLGAGWNYDSALAFLDLLYSSNGELQAPSLETIQIISGHTKPPEPSTGRRRREDPEIAVRLAILDNVLNYTTVPDDSRLRNVSYEVLQMTQPMIESMADYASDSLRSLSMFLLPIANSVPQQDVNIEVLVNEVSGWALKARSHELWAHELAALLNSIAAQEDPFYSCLYPLFRGSSKAPVELLPYLVQAVLTCGAAKHMEDTLQRSVVLSNHFSQVLQLPTADPQAVETIIHIVLHLRNFRPAYRTGELAYNQWLTVDSLLLSEAAGRCGAFASSLLFLEMATDRAEDDGEAPIGLSTPRVQKIMYDIYSNVEDPDGFYGIQNTDVMDSLRRRLDHEGEPLRALGYNLAGYESSFGKTNSDLAVQPMVSSLRNFHDLGFDRLAGTVMRSIKGTSASQNNSDPFFLELAWRMGDWDVPMTPELSESSTGRFYNAIRAVHRERDRDAARAVVESAIRAEMDRLQNIGIERMTEIKKATTNLICLRDIARWNSPSMQKIIDQGDFGGPQLSGFVGLGSSFDFATAERLSATRLSLIMSARMRESKNLLGDLVSAQSEGLVNLQIACHLRLSKLARKEGNLQAALNAVIAVRQLEQDATPSDAAQDEFARVLWDQNEHALAIQHITGLSEALDPKAARQSVLLGQIAQWTSLAKLKLAEEIRRTFRTAMSIAGANRASVQEQAQLAHDFAVFTDRYYDTLSRSPELERLKTYVVRKQDEIQRMEASLRSSPAGSRRKSAGVDKEQEVFEEERRAKEEFESEMTRYLGYALSSYAAAIRHSDDFDDSITRMCSIWLDHDTQEDVNKNFGPHLGNIPSHKFIFLGPQLAARLYRPKVMTTFNALLNRLMLRVSQDHPYHILYQIITLAHGSMPVNPASRSKAADASSQEGRGVAAAEIMARVQAAEDRPLSARAGKNMTLFAKAAIGWAYHEHDKKGERPRPGKEYAFPPGSALAQCKGLDIPIATVVPPIDLTMRYDNVPTIRRYDPTYKLAGGIHRPSIMTVEDTLGRKHVQLFKGDDEVRQDAVMEQVFQLTNDLLKRDRRASARKLSFRTYTVVPLAQRSGIIQFVSNTMAIGDWLKDAHIRYRKGVDVSADIIRKNLGSIQERDINSSKLVTMYQHQMANFKPVMRHFFTEKRREPLAWFTMRLNYARSVAVTSMVGYIVGLGDRHCSNILIDKVSGELVHIDFGIVFDEGKKLRIPEKVPFRLTNDIVDGLGITGVDGTFRQCSEHTLRVLRDSSELILTVLEVFKHDPLYSWAGDAAKMRRAQGGRPDPLQQSNTGQDKAERVLGHIRFKLSKELSLEYKVNVLILDARNPEYLAKIFIGWQPWL